MALTKQQVEWAKEHDWFRSATNHAAYRDGEWWSVDVYCDEREDVVQFDHFKSLYHWAGY